MAYNNRGQDGRKPYKDKREGQSTDSRGRKPYGEKREGQPYDSRERKPYGEKREGQPYDSRGRKPYGEKREGQPYDSRGRKPYGEKREGQPYDSRERKPYGEKREGQPYDSRERKPYGEKREGQPYDSRGRKPYGEKREGQPYDSRGRKPYGEKREGQPYDSRERKPYGEKREGQPHDSRGRKPYGEKREGQPYDAGGRKPYEEMKSAGPAEHRQHKPYGEREQSRRAYTQEQPPVAPGVVEQSTQQELPYFLMGRNVVREAVKNGRSIDRILVVDEPDGSLREIVNMARERGIVLKTVSRAKLDELCMPFGYNNRPGNHQGIIAMVPEVEYVSVQDMLAAAKEREEAPFIILLDEINDPHNLGSIIRSAACAGAHGVVLLKRRAASVTAAVSKASAGAVENIAIAKVNNLRNTIDELKGEGLWIAGADMQGTPMGEVDMKGPLALVIGNEGEGLSRLVREKCDYLVKVPMRGRMDSLNASVAAAVLMFEKNRQDGV